MRVSTLTESERAQTGFTHLIRLAYSSVAAENDFNVAATTSLINAIPLAAGDVVNFPLALVYTKTTPAGAGLSAPTISVGVTGVPAQLVASGALAAGRSRPSIDVAATAGGPFESDGAAKFVTVTLGSTGNLSLATAGEVYVYVNVTRAADLAKVQG
jgi:hypothetical protein